jgi:hypothetical protein
MPEQQSQKIELHLQGYSPEARADLENWIHLWSYRQRTREDTYADADTLLAICRNTAKVWGVLEVFKESQTWPGFERAKSSWIKAMETWIRKRVAPVLGQDRQSKVTVQQWNEGVFLARLEAGEGRDNPKCFQEYAPEIFLAAARGDCDFFRRFELARRRKPNTNQVQWHVLNCWLTAALWTATNQASANFIWRKFFYAHKKAGTKGSIRQAWTALTLTHSSTPVIKDWQFTEGNKQLPHPKPIYYRTRLPRV